MRTTLDIDSSILLELKARARKEHKSLGRLVSELTAQALRLPRQADARPEFRWSSQDMGALVDLEDKDAVWAILDGER